MKVKIKKINEQAVVPKYAHPSDSGFDLFTTEDLYLEPHKKGIAKTGLIMELPEGWGVQIRNKSGNTVKDVLCKVRNNIAYLCDDDDVIFDWSTERSDITVYIGTIDCNYRGEIGIMVKNETNKHVMIPAGTKLAQGVLEKIYQCDFEEVVEVNETDRGEGGFGSTGEK